MKVFAVLSAVIAVALAQTKPNIPEDFYAEVRLEQHARDQVLFGEGRWASDQDTQRAVEDFRYEVPGHVFPFYSYSLQRFDLQEIFEIDSFDRNECRERVVNGTMPSMWGWLKNATYIGKDQFHHVQIDLWGLNEAGIQLTVGVDPANNVNRPIIFNRESHDYQLKMEFAVFDGDSSIDQTIFDIPQECQGNSSVATVRADPTRPNISPNFYAEAELEIEQAQSRVVGQTRWGCNFTAGKLVEEWRLQDYHSHEEQYTFRLERYDMGAEFTIKSANRSQCVKTTLTGQMQNPWSFVSSAHFVRQDHDDRGVIDVWESITGGFNFTLGVYDHDPNYPVFLARATSGFAEFFRFDHFDAEAPSSDAFDVPHECPQTLVH